MDSRTRALLLDFGIALGSMVLGGLATPGLTPGAVLLATVGLAGIVAVLVVSEHTDALALLDGHRPLSFVLVAAGLLGVALLLILGRLVVPTPSGPMLLGLGAGLLGYRTVFGVVRPLPAARVAHLTLGGEWD